MNKHIHTEGVKFKQFISNYVQDSEEKNFYTIRGILRGNKYHEGDRVARWQTGKL